ncbi:MAG: type II toxin-antitoxin system mRNA interferase toxin, RelE/StbE family [Desulfobacterales bacterium]|nr:type II toxin-antitoxin system mRNA interferase toxin, RelE/StbE family [Desulfobacterales bacterium]
MRSIIWSKNFVRVARKIIKKNPVINEYIEATIKSLIVDPYAPHLETHKLKGKLTGAWACSVDYDLRIVFEFIPNEEKKENDIYLIDIGTHDEVY